MIDFKIDYFEYFCKKIKKEYIWVNKCSIKYFLVYYIILVVNCFK